MCAGKRGKYYLSPVSEGPAERAGVQAEDHLLSINGVMVSKLTHSALMKMVGWHGIHKDIYQLYLFLANFCWVFLSVKKVWRMCDHFGDRQQK